MRPLTLTSLPQGTRLIDAETQEQWIVAYCEAVTQNDAFGPYAYGCVHARRKDERVVYHSSISMAQLPPVILPS